MKKYGATLENIFSKVKIIFGERRLEQYRERIIEFHKNVILQHQQIKILINFIRYDLDDWIGRFEKLQTVYFRDAVSLEALICRNGEEQGKKLYEKRLASHVSSREAFHKKYGVEEGEKKYLYCIKKKAINKIDSFIERFGEDEGKKKFEEYTKKRVKTFKEKCKHLDTKSLKWHLEKFGTEEGPKRYEEGKVKRYYRFHKEYYIEKFGDEEGIKKYKEFMENHTLHMHRMAKICNDQGKRKSPGSYSKSSQKLFWELYELLEDSQKLSVQFAELNKEEHIVLNREGFKYIFLDFKLGNKNIEYDCDYWHNSEKDKKRDKILLELGYKILRVDFYEYKSKRWETIKKCMEFLNERN